MNPDVIASTAAGMAAASSTAAKCSSCGRPLNDPKSVERGIGPVCEGKIKAALEGGLKSLESESPHDDIHIHAPLSDGMICRRREDNTVCTNIPHIITHHSPTGFEWGYGGSGPADLALNTVEAFLRYIKHNGEKRNFENYLGQKAELYTLTLDHYQAFKFYFIARIPREGGTIPINIIVDWLRECIRKEESKNEPR